MKATMTLPRIRVALVSKDARGRLLLIQQQKNNEKYWLVPGGGVDYGENLADALERECREELEVRSVSVGRLLFIHDSIAPDGKRHVVNIYFEGHLEGTPRTGKEANLTALAHFSGSELGDLDMRPPVNSFLQQYLRGTLPDNVYLGPLWK